MRSTLGLFILAALLAATVAATGHWLSRRPPQARRSIFGITAAYLVLLGLGALLLQQASPTPLNTAEYQGISIGDRQSPGGIVHISARRLACAEVQQPSPYRSSCTLELDEGRLTILARRTPPAEANKFSGICQASFDGREWPCRFGVSHHQKLFVFLDSGLSLSADQLGALRQRFPIENLPEAVFVALLISVPLLSAAIIAAFLTALLHRTWRPVRVGLATLLGAASAVGCFFAALQIVFEFMD